MDVVSLAPVPVAALPWKKGDGPWMLAVVCKLTIALKPERSELAKRHDPIYASDQQAAELPADRILAGSDLVPIRTGVDVTAFAPVRASGSRGGQLRLRIGSIDKRVSAHGGVAHELAGHAAGTPSRRGSTPPNGHSCTLPEGFDVGFFSAAPADQRLSEVAADAELMLEQLHPLHASLATRFPNASPQLFVETSGGPSEVPMRIDGVWIDARRGVACLTWRGQLELAQLDEPGKAYVAVAGPDRRLSGAQLGELVGTLRRGGPGSRKSPEPSDDDEPEETLRTRRSHEVTDTSVLDSHEALAESAAAKKDAAPAWLRRSVPPPSTAGSPSVRAPAPSIPPGPPPARKSIPPPSSIAGSPPPSLAAPGPPPSFAGPPPSTAQPPPARPTLATNPGLGPIPPASTASPWSRTPLRQDPLADTGSLPGLEVLVEVKDAKETKEASAPKEAKEPTKPDPARQQGPRDIVELLWFDADATARLRKSFAALADELEFAPRDRRHDLVTDDRKRARDHHTHFGLLTELATIGAPELRDRVKEAVSESGRFTPPMIAAQGELAFPFDGIEVLRAAAGAVAPLAEGDRKLKDALANVEEVLASPLAGASSEPVQNMLDHLRKMFREAKRAVSPEYLDEIVQRSLLEQRRYQRRNLFGGTWIRALLTPAGSKEQLPCYLPDALAKELPMMIAFRARILAEAHVKLDQYEPCRFALRAVTLGRVLEI